MTTTFYIPNEADAPVVPGQAEPDSVDFKVIAAGSNLEGVLTGCAVTQRGAGANMSVDVAAGTGLYQTVTTVTIAGGNVVITAADATLPRYDLIYFDGAGAVGVIDGTPASTPVFPVVPANRVILAAVYVPALAASIVTGDIIDKRVTLTLPIHTILSAMHSDTLPASLVRGDVLVANSTPKLARVATGVAGSVFYGDGTDSAWTINPKIAGYVNVGSASAPVHTTAGDLTSVRLKVGDGAFGTGVEFSVTGDGALSGFLRLGSESAPQGVVAGDLTAVRFNLGNGTFISGVTEQVAGNRLATGYARLGSTVVNFTDTGFAITDVVRSAATQGDGAASPDSSFGIWEASTNSLTNGGFETNTTGWLASSTNTLAVSAVQKKFGAKSGLATLNDTATFANIIERSTAITVTATSWTASCWLYIPSTWHGTSPLQIIITGLTSVVIDETQAANMALVDQWQRIYTRFTPNAGDLSGAAFSIGAGANTGMVAADFFYIDGAQVENTVVPTPYIETDGGTASRAVGDITAASTVLNSTQMWVAMRVRLDWNSTVAPYDGSSADILSGFFSWEDSNTNRITLDYSGGKFRFFRRTAIGVGTADGVTTAFSRGDYVTLVGYVTATTQAMSVNGSAFSPVAAEVATAIAAGTFRLGDMLFTNGHEADSDILWFACGTGTLTDADAAAIHAFGNTDPTFLQLPGTPTLVWAANTVAAQSVQAPTNTTDGDETVTRLKIGDGVAFATNVKFSVTGAGALSSWFRVGSESVPSNTTAGDITAVRLFLGGTGTGAAADSILATGAISNSTYVRVGSLSAPSNTTIGDVNCVRLLVGTNTSLSGLSLAQVAFNMADEATASDTSMFRVIGAKGAAAAGSTFSVMHIAAENKSTTGTQANFQGLNVAPLNSGAATLTEFNGVRVLMRASNGTVTTAAAFHAAHPVLMTGVVSNFGFMVDNQGLAAITNAIGVEIAAQSGAGTLNVGIRNQDGRYLNANVAKPAAAPPASFAYLYSRLNADLAGATNFKTFWGLDENNFESAMSLRARTIFPMPLTLPTATASVALPANNTSSFVSHMEVPFPIKVNKILYNVSGAGNAANVIRIAIYSEDGQQKYIDVTDAVGAGTGVRTIDITDTTLAPGNYLILICHSTFSTTACSITTYTVDTTITADVASEPDLGGTLTITAGAAPATIDPTALTTVAPSGKMPVIRLLGTALGS